VLDDVAGPGLLASYEPERKPVAKFTVEQAYTRYVTRTATYLGATDYQHLAHDFNVELGYIYHSNAVMPDDGDDARGHDDPRQTHGRPGSRAPHFAVEQDGRRRSMLDLFGHVFVLLTGADGAAWDAAARRAATRFPGLRLERYRVGSPGLRDPEGRFCATYGLTPAGACLVRPDGHVAWRSKAAMPDCDATMAAVLGRALFRV
jgi:hypothetical protein